MQIYSLEKMEKGIFCTKRVKRLFAVSLTLATIVCFAFITTDKSRPIKDMDISVSANLAVSPRNTSIIVYNRVPKCGSSSIQEMMERLARKSKINTFQSKVFGQRWLTTEAKRKEAIREITTRKRPLLYDRHMHFIDFRLYNRSQPTYINVIRDPVDRKVSNYYFNQLGWEKKGNKNQRNITSFNECFKSGDSKCTNPGFLIVPFFCGHNDICRTASQDALNIAKRNVINHFPVVGILEHLDAFFSVIEYIFPTYFRGASQLYRRQNAAIKSRYRTPKYSPVSDDIREYLKGAMEVEYEFYYFIKQRFFLQFHAIRNKLDRTKSLKNSLYKMH